MHAPNDNITPSRSFPTKHLVTSLDYRHPLCPSRRTPCRRYLAGRPYRPAVLHRRLVGSTAATGDGGDLHGHLLHAAHGPGVTVVHRLLLHVNRTPSPWRVI